MKSPKWFFSIGSLGSVLLAGLGGCASLNTPYAAPHPPADLTLPAANLTTSPVAFPDRRRNDRAAWWRDLGDPALSTLVERALAANPRLDIAKARITQAKASFAGAQALLAPIGQAGGLAARGQDSAHSPEGQLLSALRAPLRSDIYLGGIGVTWESDLFGAVRQGVVARRALLEAATDVKDAVALGVAAQTARLYCLVRLAQQRQMLLKQQIDVLSRLLQLANKRHAEGATSALAARETEAQLQILRLREGVLENGHAAALDALDVLTAQPLGTSGKLLAASALLPVAIAPKILASPAEALARRPDLKAAERNVAAAHAGVGVALAGYYPTLSLGGVAGLSSTTTAALFDDNARVWAGLIEVRWRLLDWKRLNADVAGAKGKEAEALAAYRAAADEAAGEVDAALFALSCALSDNRRASDLVQTLIKIEHLADRAATEGAASRSPFLEARLKRLEAEDEVQQTRFEAVAASIDAYRALAGGE